MTDRPTDRQKDMQTNQHEGMGDYEVQQTWRLCRNNAVSVTEREDVSDGRNNKFGKNYDQ